MSDPNRAYGPPFPLFRRMSLPGSPTTSPFSLPDSPLWDRRARRLLLAGTLFRILYAACYPMNLAGDEAYYWEWSRHPDWGYYSKPPGIAWLMALVTGIGGSHTVTIRLAASVIGAGSLIVCRHLARSLFGPKASFWAVLLALATPANVLLNLMLTIDAPLVLCWTAALWCLWHWLENPGSRLPLAGLTLALGFGYLSKQMMLVFPFLAILYLGFSPKHRPLLRAGGLWIALAASLLFLVPPLLWNAGHGWITFEHTGGQLAGDTDSRPFGVTFLEFLATQAGVLSPLIWVFGMMASLGGLLVFKRLEAEERFLVLFSAPALGVMMLMALRQTMLPNWAAVYYVSTVLLLAGWMAGRANSIPLPSRWRRWNGAAAGIGLAMVALGYLWPPLIEVLGHAGHEKLDPMRRLRGHELVARQVDHLLAQAPRPSRTVIVTHGHRYHASHLAFYLPGQPKVYRWESRDQIASQYELWPDPVSDGKEGWDALVIVPDKGRKVPNRFQGAFDAFEPMGEFVASVSPDYERHYSVYLGQNLRSWPKGKPEEPDSDSASDR